MAAYSYSPAPSDPTNVMARRIGAFLIDALITVVVFMIIFQPLATKRTLT